jgi:hypothetical protein
MFRAKSGRRDLARTNAQVTVRPVPDSLFAKVHTRLRALHLPSEVLAKIAATD